MSFVFPLMIAIAIACGLPGCSGPTTSTLPPKEFWDTAFSVNGVRIQSDTLLNRSVVETGNTYRFSGFFKKFEVKPEIRVGFIGGSITEGAASSDSLHRYAGRVCEFLSKTFAKSGFVQIDAGIGATNSRFGCSRIAGDLFDFEPDLIVLEFAVNDDQNDTNGFAETMEGLIRKSLSYAPDVPVILFQTMNRHGDSANHRVQARIARHYDIPVIGYRSAIWPLIEGKRIPWESLSPDDVHPNDTGHLICGYLIYDFLRGTYHAVESKSDSKISLPPPLYSELYERAGILGAGDSTLREQSNTGWSSVLDEKIRMRYASSVRGEKLVLESQAREVTLQFRYSKDLHSRIEVKVDGEIRDTISNYFEQDWGGGYLKGQRLFKETQPSRHRIELTNLDDSPFDLRYVLFAP